MATCHTARRLPCIYACRPAAESRKSIYANSERRRPSSTSRALASLAVHPCRLAMRLRRFPLSAGRRMLMTIEVAVLMADSLHRHSCKHCNSFPPEIEFGRPTESRSQASELPGAPGPSHLGTWETTNPMRANSERLAAPQVLGKVGQKSYIQAEVSPCRLAMSACLKSWISSSPPKSRRETTQTPAK